MGRDILDVALDSSTLELYLDGVKFQPVIDQLGDAEGMRSDVWQLFHYLTDLRDELVAWRKYDQAVQAWLSQEPIEPSRAERRRRK